MSVVFEIVERDEICLLRVQGDVDLASAPLLQQKLQSLAGRRPRLEVDLSAVPYLGSPGLAVLIQARNHARRQGQEFRLLDPSPTVLDILQMSHLVGFFEVRGGGAGDA